MQSCKEKRHWENRCDLIKAEKEKANQLQKEIKKIQDTIKTNITVCHWKI